METLFLLMLIVGILLLYFGLMVIRDDRLSLFLIIIGIPLFLIGFWFSILTPMFGLGN
jgi:hypothetical protein